MAVFDLRPARAPGSGRFSKGIMAGSYPRRGKGEVRIDAQVAIQSAKWLAGCCCPNSQESAPRSSGAIRSERAAAEGEQFDQWRFALEYVGVILVSATSGNRYLGYQSDSGRSGILCPQLAPAGDRDHP